VERGVNRFDIAALVFAVCVAVASFALGIYTTSNPHAKLSGTSPGTFIVFGAVATLAATGDLRMIFRGGVTGAQRLVRHLWRMCFALLIAAGSLFLGQPQVFPESVRGTGLLFVPEIAILVMLIFWWIRVRFGKRVVNRLGSTQPVNAQ
jgi:hypothetical protein